MNRKTIPFITVILLCLLILLSGCQTQKNEIGNSPVSMKTVTQNSQGGLATFEFQIPGTWDSGPEHELSVVACPEDVVEKKFETEEDSLPFLVGIANYYYSGLTLTEKDKQMYKNLFAGETNAFEDHLKQTFADAVSMLSPNSSGQVTVPNVDFKYKHYNGTYGKITEVQYSYVYNGKKTHIIQCYREDIPYLVSGAFDDSVDLSSGKIALWVADSLKVTEHFTVKDNKIQKEGLE